MTFAPSMSFLPGLKEFLRSTGSIYTVRGYSYPYHRLHVGGIGMCRLTKKGHITSKNDLREYVDMSGFEDITSWWNQIVKFVPEGTHTLYLYEVVKE
jgi:hypothetical protein